MSAADRECEAAEREAIEAEGAAGEEGLDAVIARDVRAVDPFATWPRSAFVVLDPAVLAGVRREQQEPPDAVATPLPTLNRLCQMAGGKVGLAHGWQVIVGAASSRGKTNLALNLCVHAMRGGESVVYIALEADLEEMATRVAAIAGGVSLDRISRGHDFELETAVESHAAITALPGRFLVSKEPVYGVDDLAAAVRAFHGSHGCRTFVVDHLQLAQSGSTREIYDRVTEISHVTYSLARSDRLLSIGLSQLNRPAARNRKECPCKHDLLGGTPLEADSNIVLMIDHCEKHYRYEALARRVDTHVILDKNRHGPTGRIPVRFDFATSTLEELAYFGREVEP